MWISVGLFNTYWWGKTSILRVTDNYNQTNLMSQICVSCVCSEWLHKVIKQTVYKTDDSRNTRNKCRNQSANSDSACLFPRYVCKYRSWRVNRSWRVTKTLIKSQHLARKWRTIHFFHISCEAVSTNYFLTTETVILPSFYRSFTQVSKSQMTH